MSGSNQNEFKRMQKLQEEVNNFKKLQEKVEKLQEEVKELEEENEKLKEERNHYIYVHCWTELYNKYLGLYDISDKSLVINHSYNEVFYPYGHDGYNGYEDWELEPLTVKGSWDNWTNEYSIHKKLVTDDGRESGYYEGYIYYIIIDIEFKSGEEYQYKIKDDDYGEFIELDFIDEDTEEDIYLNDYTDQKMLRNEIGTWNATLVIRPGSLPSTS